MTERKSTARSKGTQFLSKEGIRQNPLTSAYPPVLYQGFSFAESQWKSEGKEVQEEDCEEVFLQ